MSTASEHTITIDCDTCIMRRTETCGDCVVTFLREEDLASLNVGDKIEYSARLISYGQDGFAFTLADGMLDKKEPKDTK